MGTLREALDCLLREGEEVDVWETIHVYQVLVRSIRTGTQTLSYLSALRHQKRPIVPERAWHNTVAALLQAGILGMYAMPSADFEREEFLVYLRCAPALDGPL